MKNRLAKIYVTEMKENKYLVYMAVDDYLYGLGTYRYNEKGDTWKLKGDGYVTEGQAQRKMYRAMVIGMMRMGMIITELTAGTLVKPLVWKLRGERTMCATEININIEAVCVIVKGPHTEWGVAIDPAAMQDATKSTRELYLVGVPQWAAHFVMTTMRQWKKIIGQEEGEVQNGRAS